MSFGFNSISNQASCIGKVTFRQRQGGWCCWRLETYWWNVKVCSKKWGSTRLFQQPLSFHWLFCYQFPSVMRSTLQKWYGTLLMLRDEISWNYFLKNLHFSQQLVQELYVFVLFIDIFCIDRPKGKHLNFNFRVSDNFFSPVNSKTYH